MFMKSKTFAATAALSIAASGAFAQGQEGLVNVSVDDNTVQVPVSVAANVCDLDVNALARQFVGSDDSACEIDQETAAANGINTGSSNGNGNGKQNGLVNLSVDGNTIQVPVGVAANVCDVDANVIAQQVKGTDDSACEIDQETAAENGLDRFGDIGTTGAIADDVLDDAEDAVDDASEAADRAADAAEDEIDETEDEIDEAEDEADEAEDELEEEAEDETEN